MPSIIVQIKWDESETQDFLDANLLTTILAELEPEIAFTVTDASALLKSCQMAKDYIDHPEQKSQRAWALIGWLEGVIAKYQGDSNA